MTHRDFDPSAFAVPSGGSGSQETVIDSALVAMCFVLWSTTRTVNVSVPFVLGLPEMIPVDLFRWRPLGRWLDTTDHL